VVELWLQYGIGILWGHGNGGATGMVGPREWWGKLLLGVSGDGACDFINKYVFPYDFTMATVISFLSVGRRWFLLLLSIFN
jgi:hypothetical protein